MILLRHASLLALTSAIWLTACAAAAEPSECFDVRVAARVVRQTPTVPPSCDDCVYMRWPWILDLQVQRVREGVLKSGRVVVLNVQHTWARSKYAGNWWLRRNSLGLFNAVHVDYKNPVRCPAGGPAASPYVQPEPGRTLDDLRREGEQEYGSRTAN
jgi:hypothetical protein